MMSVCVDPKRIDEVWPRVKQAIERAINKVGFSDFADVERSVMAGKSLVWMAYDGQVVHAVATTALVNGICEITACSGTNLKSFLPLIKDLEAFARDEKCRAMRIFGRKGWKRVLKDYIKSQSVLERAHYERCSIKPNSINQQSQSSQTAPWAPAQPAH